MIDPGKGPRPPGTKRPAGRLTRAAELLGGRRIVLLSNREPYLRRRRADGTETFARTKGGLVSALDPAMRACGGVWIAGSEGGKADRFQIPGDGPTYSLVQLPLSPRDLARYYYGFANRALWPLFHYFIGRCHFDSGEWSHYKHVNKRFANALVQEATEDDFVWIQDYHFLLVPDLVREALPRASIAFFLHIPFPGLETFRVLPRRDEVLRGLLGADLVGLQTQVSVNAFLESCEGLLGVDVDRETSRVRWQGRWVRVGAFPIGIDFDEHDARGRDPKIVGAAGRIRRSVGGGRIVLGVDRLDYTKGIPERFEALSLLLERHPELRREVTLIQIAVPSRARVKEYRALKRSVDEMVGRINGRFGDAGWVPIHYLYRGFDPGELAAYYRAADVALVTPLRDGMNLVAKEYVATRADGEGALVLSELAGASQEMSEAYIVNPFDVDAVSSALHHALLADRPARVRRMRRMRERVRKGDVKAWTADVIRATLIPDA